MNVANSALVGVLAVAMAIASSLQAASPKDVRRRAFTLDGGKPSASDAALRTREATLPPTTNVVHVYASFCALDSNPVARIDGAVRGAQRVLLGQRLNGELVPAIRFGIVDSGRGPAADQSLLAVSAHDGRLDHFGDLARPRTPL